MPNADTNNFKGCFGFAQLILKLTEFILRCWMFNVRCSIFSVIRLPEH
ncbi:hypothetical protein D1AOALGA4SA_11326 [Olavius algarvensis Delta 1 endosymbiont]|nr:hypothetical protein D1AOALGA4SA_11326 [Olavius algarvensis Delta 1 endosymbiont]